MDCMKQSKPAIIIQVTDATYITVPQQIKSDRIHSGVDGFIDIP